MISILKHIGKWFAVLAFISISLKMNAQNDLLQKIKLKNEKIRDYIAEGTLKIDVNFINTPQSKVKIFYKKPDQFKVKKEGGISILPKGGVNVDLNSILENKNNTIVSAGELTIDNVLLKVLKILPLDEESEVLLTTLFIDEKELLIKRSKVSTRESGTFQMDLYYEKYKEYGLPDKVIFSFDTKDYKLPKAVTFEYESGEKKKEADRVKNKKGKIEINYTSYKINTGLSDAIFKEK